MLDAMDYVILELGGGSGEGGSGSRYGLLSSVRRCCISILITF